MVVDQELRWYWQLYHFKEQVLGLTLSDHHSLPTRGRGWAVSAAWHRPSAAPGPAPAALAHY
eukprot:564045-Rhodomonas_salina.1